MPTIGEVILNTCEKVGDEIMVVVGGVLQDREQLARALGATAIVGTAYAGVKGLKNLKDKLFTKKSKT